VLPAALHASVVPRARLGLYWEEYGASGTVAPEVSVIVVKARFRHREPYPVGHAECPPRYGPAISLRWKEPPPADPRRSGRSVVLDLGNLREGTYQVGIELKFQVGPPACTSREFSVNPEGK
jgi:hypothetical protein